MIRFVCSVKPFSVTLPFPGEDHGRTPVGPELKGGVQSLPSHQRDGPDQSCAARVLAPMGSSFRGFAKRAGSGAWSAAITSSASGPAEQSGGKEKHRTGRPSDGRPRRAQSGSSCSARDV